MSSETVFNFTRRNCRIVKEETERNGRTFVGPALVFEDESEDWRPVETEEEVLELCNDLYHELYENPQPIGYFTLGKLLGEATEDYNPTMLVDILASAVDLGCRHSTGNQHRMDDKALEFQLRNIHFGE